ncbi:MAG: hypothetical protein JSS66_13135 [Armatimonadetes bacterium]|nr:hypothetical protein [Armatimonadota bacterium]
MAVSAKEKSFAEDVAFLKKHTNATVLKGEGGAAVVVIPQYQCRVMTSTADAASGEGAGWINYKLIQTGKTVPHINVFGGEDRFWLGPEGGQFSIFFKNLSVFDLAHWQTPAPIDTDAYKVVNKTTDSITCSHQFRLVNYSGSLFQINVNRQVKVMSMQDARTALGIGDMPGIKYVGFQTKNTVTNVGSTMWDKLSGMLSIWILGMYKPSDQTTVIAPYNTAGSGNIVNDTYFGKVPANRLKVQDGLVLFSGDGKMRTKIGLPPSRAKDVVGSYDASRNMLTIVKYTFDASASDYVNSMWELQDNPFGGDVVNSYNDGPPSPGAKPLGPFYELETSSPAMNLGPGGSHTHYSQTFHFSGPREELDKISKKVLGAELDMVATTFK